LHSRDQRPAFAQAVAAADFPGADTYTSPVKCLAVTAVPVDDAADMESESVRWKVGWTGRKCLLHEQVIARWNGSLQGACNTWWLGAGESDME